MCNHQNRKITLGIGLTDRCNADCPHCYSRPENSPHDIPFETIKAIVDKLPLKSVNFGTGESIFHPQFLPIIEYVSSRGIDMAVTTNGTTAVELSDEHLKLFHDLDFSLDFPTVPEHDGWRSPGMFKSVVDGLERCAKLGVEASIVACLMKNNYHRMGALTEFAVKMGVNLRINVYKPVYRAVYKTSYQEFWSAVSAMADKAYFISCTEPIVCAAIGKNGSNSLGSPCGQHSLRIHPDGKVVSCIYFTRSDLTIMDLIEDSDAVFASSQKAIDLPLNKICQGCEHLTVCQGGCASRRIYDRTDIDEYCFIRQNEKPKIAAKWKNSKGLVHEDYLCTMIFSG